MGKQKKPTRRMHYVPAFYLAEFTDGRTRESRLTIFEPRAERAFRDKAGNVALEKDFYLVEPDDENPTRSPQHIEDFLAVGEGLIAPVLKTVAETQEMPDPTTPGLDTLMWFAAFAKARAPKARRIWNELAEEGLKSYAKTLVETPESWDDALAEVPGLRAEGEEDPAYEKVKAYFENWEVTAGGANWHAGQMLQDAQMYHDDLVRRRWILAVAAPGTPDFITSDTPGEVHWFPPDLGRLPETEGDPLADPRFGYYLPLTRRCVLIGLLPPPEIRRHLRSRVEVGEPMVAAINSMTLLGCERFVFAPIDDFVLLVRTQHGWRIKNYSEVKSNAKLNLEWGDRHRRIKLERAAANSARRLNPRRVEVEVEARKKPAETPVKERRKSKKENKLPRGKRWRRDTSGR